MRAPLAVSMLWGIWGLAMPLQSLALELVTAEEAALPPSPIRYRGVVRAPGIVVVMPGEAAVKSPFRLKITFEERGGQKVDPSSVELSYVRKTPVNLSERIKPRISAAGIDIVDAVTPPGEHTFLLRVRDMSGRQAESRFTIDVDP